MYHPITFRTHLTMNAATVLLIAVMLLVSHTFANPPAEKIAPAGTLQTTPTTISYQGHLTDAEGKSITGTVTMTFKLYAAPTGGDPLWTEQRTGANAVPVTNGLFKVSLGSVTPLDTAVFTQSLWLGIAVGSDAEMTPREQVGSVPYAAVAGNGMTWRTPTFTFFEDATNWTPTENAVWDIRAQLSQAGVPANPEMVLLAWRPSLYSDYSEFELLDANNTVLGTIQAGTVLGNFEVAPVGVEYGTLVAVPGATRKIRYAAVGAYTQTPPNVAQRRRSLVIYGWK